VSPTISSRLGPVTASYSVTVRQYNEYAVANYVCNTCQYGCYPCDYYYDWYSCGEDTCYGYIPHQTCGCVTACNTANCGQTLTGYSYYRDGGSPTTMSASKQLLLLPSGASIYTQPSSSYTAASTTSVSVTFRLNPVLTVVSGYTGFSAEFVVANEQGAICVRLQRAKARLHVVFLKVCTHAFNALLYRFEHHQRRWWVWVIQWRQRRSFANSQHN
jgi:hypothetical protein